MYTSRRDYLLRIIEEVSQLLARLIFKRKNGQHQEALLGVVQACERLFGMEADRLFQFTPDQHYAMLTENATDDDARGRVLLYAALQAEAGRIFGALAKPEQSRAASMTALRMTLRAQAQFPTDAPPLYAPVVADLLAAVRDQPLDDDIAELLREAGKSPVSPSRKASPAIRSDRE